MIVIDTHIWVWWIQEDTRLTQDQHHWLQVYQSSGLGVSLYSCWEVAKLVEYGRLVLPRPLEDWFASALTYPGVRLLDLNVPILIESTRLQGFHKDPADQIIVATARLLGVPILTADTKILEYGGVQTL